jgi:hypothetical protein
MIYSTAVLGIPESLFYIQDSGGKGNRSPRLKRVKVNIGIRKGSVV